MSVAILHQHQPSFKKRRGRQKRLTKQQKELKKPKAFDVCGVTRDKAFLVTYELGIFEYLYHLANGARATSKILKMPTETF
jgi:hypothetical protein